MVNMLLFFISPLNPTVFGVRNLSTKLFLYIKLTKSEMKKLFLLALVAFTLMAASCKKQPFEESKQPFEESKQSILVKILDGETWKETKYGVIVGTDTFDLQQPGASVMYEFEEIGKGKYIVKKTGEVDVVENLTWSVSDDGNTVSISGGVCPKADTIVLTVSENSTSEKQIWASSAKKNGALAKVFELEKQ
jgi:hypothetical protein